MYGEVEVWSIFVRPAVTFPDGFLRLNKANLANPFYHFEVRWFSTRKRKRCIMHLGKRPVVHLVGQQHSGLTTSSSRCAS